VAKEQLENILKVNIEPSGLFVDSEQFYLAASPDGLIGDGWISGNKMSF